MSEQRKMYESEFKLNAVRLLQRGKQSIKELAEELGINYYTLAEWKRDYDKYGEQAFPGHGHSVYGTDAEKEIAELKKQLRRVEMERDILKKAMAISLKEK